MKRKLILTSAAGIALVGATFHLAAQDAPGEKANQAPFGQEADVEYSKQVWAVLQAFRLVGDERIHAFPYEGNEPHGKLLQTFKMKAEVGGRSGEMWVKNNFDGAGLSKTDVLTAPEKHLGAVTIMFKREEGYDPDNQNWFYAKYLPDGSLDKSPQGVALAGRVMGCIQCHNAAPGKDMLYSTVPPLE